MAKEIEYRSVRENAKRKYVPESETDTEECFLRQISRNNQDGKKKLNDIYLSDSDEDFIENSPPKLDLSSKLSKKYVDAETQTTTSYNKYFINQCSVDPRNENFARLIAYELEYLPEEKRDYIPLILNIIRILRGDVETSEVMNNILKKSSTENDDTESSSSQPSSPSILSKFHYKKNKINNTYKENTLFLVDKGNQAQETEIADAMVYKLTEDKRLTYSSDALPKVDFDYKYPLDTRNQDVARLIVFELERMLENGRSSAYTQILNLIYIAKGDLSSNKICAFYNKFDDQVEEIPLNITFRKSN